MELRRAEQGHPDPHRTCGETDGSWPGARSIGTEADQRESGEGEEEAERVTF